MKLGNKIEQIYETDLNDFRVKLRFSNGKTGFVPLNHIFKSPKNLSEEILRGQMFDKCFIESGALAWSNGFDLCPDALYKWFEEQNNSQSCLISLDQPATKHALLQACPELGVRR